MPQLLIIGAIIGAFFLVTRAAGAGSFTANLTRFAVDLKRAQILRIPAGISLEIENPSDQAIKINAVTAAAFIGSTEVGQFSNLSGFEIRPRSKQTLSFEGALFPAQLTKAGVNVVQSVSSGSLPAVTIKGAVNAGGIVVDFEKVFA